MSRPTHLFFVSVFIPVLALLASSCAEPRPPRAYECHGPDCGFTCPDDGYCPEVDCSSSGNCDAECPGSAECFLLNCQDSGYCDLQCSSDVLCQNVDCSNSGSCDVACTGSSNCPHIRCVGTGECDVECSGDVDCGVNCTGAGSCWSACTGSSRCLLDCSESNDCGFSECGEWGEMSCPDGVIVCNRECPTCGDGMCERVAGEQCKTCSEDCGECG